MSDLPDAPSSPSLPARWRTVPRWARTATYLAAFVVVLLVVGLLSAVALARRPLPQTDGRLEIPGITASASVRRDAHGVPHLYAENTGDLFFAQGFVQAQDRFFQLDQRRRLASGRLSELYGEDTLETDQLVRALGLRTVAERELALLDPTTVAHLESFAAGVNAYLDGRSPAEIALEYAVLDLAGVEITLDPWTPVDSLAVLKVFAWEQRGPLVEEIERAALHPRLPPERIEELFPSSTQQSVAGNAWALAGTRTESRAALLVAAPEDRPGLPGPWIQVGLHCADAGEPTTSACPIETSGLALPGFPGVLSGHNEDIAWAATPVGADVTDLYLEAVEGDRYLRRGEWVPFAERPETIAVAGEDDFVFTARSTRHGPVLSDVAEVLASVGANAPLPAEVATGLSGGEAVAVPDRGTGYAVALSWPGLRPGRTADGLLDLMTADDWQSFRAGAALLDTPVQRFVYADDRGHIASLMTGALPVRRPGHRGTDAVPGWLPRYDWAPRPVPRANLPVTLDPAQGQVESGVAGLPELLRARDDWDVATSLALLEEAGAPLASVLVPRLLALDPGGVYESAGVRLLRRWDGRQRADSGAAAYLNAVWRQLLVRTFADELPTSVRPDGGERWVAVVETLLDDPANAWWDDASTEDARETRDDILVASMIAARNELTSSQALRSGSWEWGRTHRLELRPHVQGGVPLTSPTRVDLPVLGGLFDRGPWPVGGGPGSLKATAWDASQTYDVVRAPVARWAVPLVDPDLGRWVVLGGASGHPLSAHVDDQTDLWRAGGSIPWPFSAAAVDESAENRLSLHFPLGDVPGLDEP